MSFPRYPKYKPSGVEWPSSQFYQQVNSERTWEEIRKPYYNVWPSIVPMLTRLNLDLDSGLIQLPLPVLCIRLPTQHNPLEFHVLCGGAPLLANVPRPSWERAG